jgi:SLOG cluster4 family
MESVFGTNPSRLNFTTATGQEAEDEREGFRHLFIGAMLGCAGCLTGVELLAPRRTRPGSTWPWRACSCGAWTAPSACWTDRRGMLHPVWTELFPAGVRAENGLVIDIRPNDIAEDASPDLSAVIVTNLGEARNAVIIWSADAVIAIGGSWGTLSEIALAKRRGGIPVITLGGWTILAHNGNPLPDPITSVPNPQRAVDLALAAPRS